MQVAFSYYKYADMPLPTQQSDIDFSFILPQLELKLSYNMQPYEQGKPELKTEHYRKLQ